MIQMKKVAADPTAFEPLSLHWSSPFTKEGKFTKLSAQKPARLSAPASIHFVSMEEGICLLLLSLSLSPSIPDLFHQYLNTLKCIYCLKQQKIFFHLVPWSLAAALSPLLRHRWIAHKAICPHIKKTASQVPLGFRQTTVFPDHKGGSWTHGAWWFKEQGAVGADSCTKLGAVAAGTERSEKPGLPTVLLCRGSVLVLSFSLTSRETPSLGAKSPGFLWLVMDAEGWGKYKTLQSFMTRLPPPVGLKPTLTLLSNGYGIYYLTSVVAVAVFPLPADDDNRNFLFTRMGNLHYSGWCDLNAWRSL